MIVLSHDRARVKVIVFLATRTPSLGSGGSGMLSVSASPRPQEVVVWALLRLRSGDLVGEGAAVSWQVGWVGVEFVDE